MAGLYEGLDGKLYATDGSGAVEAKGATPMTNETTPSLALYLIDKICSLGPIIAGIMMLLAVSGIHGSASGPDQWIIWPIGMACIWTGLRNLARWRKTDRKFEYFL